MNQRERIEELPNLLGMNLNEIAQRIGEPNGTKFYQILNNRNGISKNLSSKILTTFPQINEIWLLTGKGEKLNYEIKHNVIKEENYVLGKVTVNEKLTTEPQNGIPVIPIEAMAGYANGDVQIMQYEIIDTKMIKKFMYRGAKYFIEVGGNSMYPKYSNGDMLACRPITDVTFIQWNKVYVLDTDQGPLVKRIIECEGEENKIICKSDNKDYPPFKMLKDSIRKISVIVGVIRMEL